MGKYMTRYLQYIVWTKVWSSTNLQIEYNQYNTFYTFQIVSLIGFYIIYSTVLIDNLPDESWNWDNGNKWYDILRYWVDIPFGEDIKYYNAPSKVFLHLVQGDVISGKAKNFIWESEFIFNEYEKLSSPLQASKKK